MSSIRREFTGTCENIMLFGCDESLFHLDPCDCARYYRCANNQMVEYTCTETTLWDQTTKNCAHTSMVYLRDDCDNPWTRCNVSETRTEILKRTCTMTTVSTEATVQTTTNIRAPEPEDGDIDPGLAIGLIVAGALLAVIIIAAIFVYMRHRKHKGIKSKRPTIANNPEYFENGREADPYDFINDSHMSDPTYRGEPSGISSNGGTTMTTQSGSVRETTEYDNSAFRSPISGSDIYTQTLSRSQQEREPPYEHLKSRDSNSNDINSGSHNGISVNRPGSDINSAKRTNNDQLRLDSFPVNSGTQDDMNTPQYFTLTRENT